MSNIQEQINRANEERIAQEFSDNDDGTFAPFLQLIFLFTFVGMIYLALKPHLPHYFTVSYEHSTALKSTLCLVLWLGAYFYKKLGFVGASVTTWFLYVLLCLIGF